MIIFQFHCIKTTHVNSQDHELISLPCAIATTSISRLATRKSRGTFALALGLKTRHFTTGTDYNIALQNHDPVKRHSYDLLPHSLKPSPPDRPGTKRRQEATTTNFIMSHHRAFSLLFQPCFRATETPRATDPFDLACACGVSSVLLCVSCQESVAALSGPVSEIVSCPCTFAVHEGVHAGRQGICE